MLIYSLLNVKVLPVSDRIAKWLHRELTEKREEREQAKCQLRDDLFGDSCITAAMAKHFGSRLPNGEAHCGRCSFCIDGEPAQVRTFKPDGVDAQKIEAVLREVSDRENPRPLARLAMGTHSPRIKYHQLDQIPSFG